jgi:hypothetical protein
MAGGSANAIGKGFGSQTYSLYIQHLGSNSPCSEAMLVLSGLSLLVGKADRYRAGLGY